MKINYYAHQKGKELALNLSQNNGFESSKLIFDQHFLYSRFYLKDWSIYFKKGFFDNIHEKIISYHGEQFFDSFFELNIPITEKHIDTFYYIINNKQIPFITIDDFKREHDLSLALFYYKNYIIELHLNSIIYHFYNINKSYFETFYDFITLINKHSITQKPFQIEKHSYFKIPLNKATTFLFYINQKLIGIDILFSCINDKKFIPLHSLFINYIYDQSPQNIQKKFIDMHKIETPKIISNKDYFFKKDSNIEHILSDFNYSFSSFLSIKDQLVIRKLASEKTVFYNQYLQESFFEKHPFYVYQHNTNIIDNNVYYDLRKQWQKSSFKSLFNQDHYLSLFYLIDADCHSFFSSIVSNIIEKMNFLLDHYEFYTIHSMLYEFGFQTSTEIVNFINEINLQIEQDNLKLDHFKNDPKKDILKRFINHIENTS